MHTKRSSEKEENKTLGKSRHTYYEGWNFSSGNYLFTTDTK